MDYFAAFYSLYPRKVAKVVAQKAALKIQDAEWPAVMEGLHKYIKAWRGKEKQFIPLPSTFLNQRRWEDEIEVEEEVQHESYVTTFLKALRCENNKVLPDLPFQIKQIFFRMGTPWAKLQSMSDEEVERKFMLAYAPAKAQPDCKMASANDLTDQVNS